MINDEGIEVWVEHGTGTKTWPDKTYYDGEWYEGDICGQGQMNYLHGLYKGDFKYNKANGTGMYQNHDGLIYQGEWLDDKPHGKGK